MNGCWLAGAWVVLAAVAGGCHRDASPHGPAPAAPSSADAGSAAPRCKATGQIAARIVGSWLGNATEPESLGLVVEAFDGSPASPSDREVASLTFASLPFVAAEVKSPGDFCSDDGSTPAALAVRCLDGGKVSHLVARLDADRQGLKVVVDGGAPRSWRVARFAGECFEITPFGAPRDLEPLRAAWGRDTPSARCAEKPARGPVHVPVRFPVVADNFSCLGGRLADAGPKSGPVDRSRVVLELPSPAKPVDLGLLSEQCAGLHVTRYDDADAVAIGTSDMGVENRFAYRLGDRLYYTSESGSIAIAELPCGAHVVFDVPPSVLTEHEKLRDE